MEERLKYIFQNTNSWLKFSENKNAELIAFNSAVLFGGVSLLSQFMCIPYWAKIYLCFCVPMLIFGIISSLLSFLPQLRLTWPFAQTSIDNDDNLLYFGHAARYTPDSYIKAFAKAINREDDHITLVEKWLAEQIVMNSQIALYKYRWFKVALWFNLTAFATPIVPIVGLVIYLFKREEYR